MVQQPLSFEEVQQRIQEVKAEEKWDFSAPPIHHPSPLPVEDKLIAALLSVPPQPLDDNLPAEPKCDVPHTDTIVCPPQELATSVEEEDSAADPPPPCGGSPAPIPELVAAPPSQAGGPVFLGQRWASAERHFGVIQNLLRDRNQTTYGFIEEEGTKDSRYFHISALVNGAVPQVGARVSFERGVNPLRPGEKVADRVRVEDGSALRRGTVVSWNEEKKRGLIEEKGELNAAFNETGWQGPQPPLYGILVEFIAVPHRSRSDLRYARRVVPIGPFPVARTCVYLLWDFDHTLSWDHIRARETYRAMVDRLCTDGVIASARDVRATAFALNRCYSNRHLTKCLEDLSVELRVASELKEEAADRLLERYADELSLRPDTKAVALVTSDKDFVPLTQRLRQRGVGVVVFHEAVPGSSHEAVLCTHADRAVRLADLAPPRPAAGPAGRPPTTPSGSSSSDCWAGSSPSPQPSTLPNNASVRRQGVVQRVATDKNNTLYGFIKEDLTELSHFFHSKAMEGGGRPEVGQRVSFVVSLNPQRPNEECALQVCVEAPPPPPPALSGSPPPPPASPDADGAAGPQHCGFVSQLGLGEEDQAVYGHIVEEETQNKYYFHSSAVVGRQPKLKDWVLFVLGPHPACPGEQCAAQVVCLPPPTSPGASQGGAEPPGPPAQRLYGVIRRLLRDKHQTIYGFIEEQGSGGKSHYFHSNSMEWSGPPEVGQWVSFEVGPNPQKPTDQCAFRVRREAPAPATAPPAPAGPPDPPASPTEPPRQWGHIRAVARDDTWGLQGTIEEVAEEEKAGLKYVFYGDSLSEKDGAAPQLQLDQLVSFVLGSHPAQPEEPCALQVRVEAATGLRSTAGPGARHSPAEGAGGGPPGPQAGRGRDERRRGTVRRLLVDKNQTAYGFLEDDETKKSWYFHSSWMEGGVFPLVDQRVSFVLAPHPMRPGDQYVTQVRAEETLGPPAPAPPLAPDSGAIALREGVRAIPALPGTGRGEPGGGQRRRGVIRRLLQDKHQTAYGFIEEDVGGERLASHYFHSKSMEWGGPPAVGQRVTFVLATNPPRPHEMCAFHVRLQEEEGLVVAPVAPSDPPPTGASGRSSDGGGSVDDKVRIVPPAPPPLPSGAAPSGSGGRQFGTIRRVLEDRHKTLYGIIEEEGTGGLVSHYFHSKSMEAGGPPVVGQRVSFVLAPNPPRPHEMCAFHVRLEARQESGPAPAKPLDSPTSRDSDGGGPAKPAPWVARGRWPTAPSAPAPGLPPALRPPAPPPSPTPAHSPPLATPAPTPVPSSSPGGPQRLKGTIMSIKGDYGWITPPADGQPGVYFPFSQWRGSQMPARGLQVSYVLRPGRQRAGQEDGGMACEIIPVPPGPGAAPA